MSRINSAEARARASLAAGPIFPPISVEGVIPPRRKPWQIIRSSSPKVWVKYTTYDERFPTLKMWVGGCYDCSHRIQYHSWAATMGSVLEHRSLGCRRAGLRDQDRRKKYDTHKGASDQESLRVEMKNRSCGIRLHGEDGGS